MCVLTWAEIGFGVLLNKGDFITCTFFIKAYLQETLYAYECIT